MVDIPISDEVEFDVDDFFYGFVNKKVEKRTQLKEEAERYIYEGNQAFHQKNAFIGIEKYQQGIKIYKELNDYEKVLELLRKLSDYCVASNHYVLAKKSAEELYNLSEKYKNIFYRAEANYLIGYLLLKEVEDNNLEPALKDIQNASIDYEKAGDFAGAGKCYNKIGTIYQSRLNIPFNSCLFYEQAIRSYNIAILKGHPLRTSLWSKSELLTQNILELKDIIYELIPQIENLEERKKIKDDLNSIQLNF